MDFKNDTNYFDQHFLVDQEIVNRFIEEAHLSSLDEVVEIGPGKGNISELIAPKVKHLTCIELDKRLTPYLDKLTNEYHNVDIIYDNAIDAYIPACNKIITSLPYSIIEPFIEKLIRCDFDEALMIIGNNFATNIKELSKTKLSLLTNAFFKVEKIMEIIPDSFNPKPRVMSAMVRLIPLSSHDLVDNLKLFLFREIFFYRTKKLKNSLIEAIINYHKLCGLMVTQKESRSLIESLGLDKTLLEKTIEVCSNKEIENIYNSFETLEKTKQLIKK